MTEQAPETKKRNSKARIALASLAALAAIEGAGAGITELTNNQQISITQTVPEDLKWPYTLVVENLLNKKVPDQYSNKSDGKEKFGEANIERVTSKEAIDNNLLEPKMVINDSKTVTVSTLLPGIFPLEDISDNEIKTETHFVTSDSTSFIEKHYVMPDGFQLNIPKGVHYALLNGDPKTQQDPNLVYSIVTFFYDPINDLSFHLSFECTGFIPNEGINTMERETYNQLYNPGLGGNFEDLPVSDGIAQIARPALPNQTLDMGMFVKSGKITKNTSLSEAVSKSLNATWENVISKNQKLILLSSK